MNRNLRVLMAAIAAAITHLLLITEDPDTGTAPITNPTVVFIICSMMFFIMLRVTKLVNEAHLRDAAVRQKVNKPY